MKEEKIELDGEVVDSFPNLFKISTSNGEILATISGKMRKNYIKILPGDRVKVEISTYDLTKGIITYRYR